jgi:type II secretory pathway component PulK
MQMIKNHGVIETIRRTGTQGNTATLEFMASKGRLEDTSEWLVSHGFPSLFSEADRQHALKRLKDACLV